MSSDNHGDSDFWNAPFGAITSHTQMQSVDDLVVFWSAALGLFTSHV